MLNRLNRREACELLNAQGFPTAKSWLENNARRGPPYHLYNGKAVYEVGALLSWAQARLREPKPKNAEAVMT